MFILLICVSCTNQDSYDSRVELTGKEDREELVVKLENSKVDYKITEDKYIHFNSKDKDAIFEALFTSRKRAMPVVPEYTKSWTINQEKAKEIILNKYPNILAQAYMVGPVTSKLPEEIEGFSKANETVWHVRIIFNNKSGAYALFFVHPETGEIFVIQAPGEESSADCKKAGGEE